MARSIKEPVEEEAIETIASAGVDLADAVGSEIDDETLSEASEQLAQGLQEVPPLSMSDLQPALEEEYRELAGAADDIVNHLVSVGFFEAIDEVAPPFDADFLEDCLVHALGNATDVESLQTAGVADELADFVSEAIDHSEEIEHNVRWEPENPDKVSPMTTRGATEGVVDWLDDLGRHLWMSEELTSEEMLADASTHTKAFGAAILLIADGAAGLDGDSDPEDDLAKVVGGIALHTYHQRRVPEDLSWITDEMRAPGAWASD